MLTHSALCLRCRGVRPLRGAVLAQTKNGKSQVRGNCGECGGAVFRFVRPPAAPIEMGASQ